MSDVFDDEWIAAAGEALAELPATSALDGIDLDIDYVISGSPSGKVTITVALLGGAVGSVVSGKSATPDIVISMKYDVAVKILRGEMSSDVAYMTGALKVEGAHVRWMLDLRTVRAAALAALEPLMADAPSG